ncbi:MAG: bifunctional diaminohydroxyphosphoribosylaminopyrimidine deaminase/5-amino-6-(5-phosphoribosylamino)uracil reductase RibD [Candidatus Magasanikbacteria bacterium]|nr:bifunctional diaminohydroxyphosphoribosylaminopyrimidine deaminase/5-amino-6-(5-phosphoribosylamino)uracil reductase RibD [Candidatus Magasanikbacteria bacterium]
MSKITSTDFKLLLETLELAKRGQGFANPNPMVGAVVVKQGKIISTGYFHGIGKPHAEIEALKNSRQNVAGATLYVNMEPHCFYGRTPPCTTAIIRSKIKRVVCITADPNPRVTRRGFKELRAAGIKVDIGGPIAEANNLNEAYFKYFAKNRPFIALKWAQSLDGKIATRTHDSKWISNDQSRQYAHVLRGQYQAILVGSNTLRQDNPHLGARHKKFPDPVRIILDSQLSLSLQARVLRDKNVIIAAGSSADKNKARLLLKKGFTLWSFSSKHIPLKQLFKKLYQAKILSVLVEGGGEVLGSFVDQKLFDKIHVFVAPKIIGGRAAIGSIGGTGVAEVKLAPQIKNISFKNFRDNFLIEGYAETI